MSTGDITIHKHDKFEFVCWSWSTSNAWGHEVRLCEVGAKAGVELSKARVRYYNRTWEMYQYQSAMYQALENYKEQELKRFIDNYKYTNGLKGWNSEAHEEYEKPLPRGKRKELVEEFNKNPLWEELKSYVERGE